MTSKHIDINVILKVLEIFEYVSKFNQDISTTSKELHVDICDDIEKDIDNKENIIKLLQYQDIMSQQLDCSVKAIEKINMDLKYFIDDKLDNRDLLDKLSLDTIEFKDKYQSFEGTKNKEENKIDFF
jgi:flagellar biosynthesis/type III secretory pathway ATPase